MAQKKILIALFFIFSVQLNAQIDQYIGNKKEVIAENLHSDYAHLVGMTFSLDLVPFGVKANEEKDYNESLLSPLSRCLNKKVELVNKLNLEAIRSLQTPVIVANLTSYKEYPAMGGQHEDELTVVFHFFNTPQDTAPYKSLKLVARGGRDWGDNNPLENAIKTLVEKIESSCKK